MTAEIFEEIMNKFVPFTFSRLSVFPAIELTVSFCYSSLSSEGL